MPLADAARRLDVSCGKRPAALPHAHGASPRLSGQTLGARNRIKIGNMREVLLYGLGRAFVDFRPRTRAIDAAIWKSVPAIFSWQRYEVADDRIDLTFDWRFAVSEIRRSIKVPTLSEFVASKGSIEYEHTRDDSVRLPVRSVGVAPSQLIASLIEHHLCEMFLIMNIAFPGAFSAMQIGIPGTISRTVRLSSEILEKSWAHSVEHGWPQIQPVSLEATYRWYHALGVGLSQVAHAKVAKVLFSLLQLAQLQGPEPPAIQWLAQALEALFGLSASAPHALLAQRIGTVLPGTNQKTLRRLLRGFYEERNAFAHGGADVLHPMRHDIMDEAVNHFDDKWWPPVMFATSVIVATLQVLVRRGWRDLSWSEECFGVAL